MLTGPRGLEHNRLGAVFVPDDAEKGGDLTAHVIEGTPAYEAGIRDGDILLKVGDLYANVWTKDTALSCIGFWSQEPRKKFELTLKRGEKEYKTEVVLRDLIGPNVGRSK